MKRAERPATVEEGVSDVTESHGCCRSERHRDRGERLHGRLRRRSGAPTRDDDRTGRDPAASTVRGQRCEVPPAFKDAFGDQPSYGQITGMKMAGRTLEIATKLDPGSTHEDSDGPAICQAGANLAIDFGELGDGIEWVTVLGSDGVGLGSCA